MSLFFTKSRGASERPIFFIRPLAFPEPPCAVPELVALELCSLGLSKKGEPRPNNVNKQKLLSNCPIKSSSGRVFGAFLQVTMTCNFFEKARFEGRDNRRGVWILGAAIGQLDNWTKLKFDWNRRY